MTRSKEVNDLEGWIISWNRVHEKVTVGYEDFEEDY